jgi:1-deoxy-D-xylulose-5-phosphate reductoisomerase
MARPRNLVVLGSTGSIGAQTLEVVRRHREMFQVVGLAANTRLDVLARQMAEFKPKLVSLGHGQAQGAVVRTARRLGIKIVENGLEPAAGMSGADMVVNALVGAAGLVPTMAAIEAGHDVALANKETLVAGGDLVMEAARRKRVRILPIDSEHAALHQCLDGRDPATVRRLILTASGGPFRGHSRSKLRSVTARHALRHPTWRMGPKITVDSATLMNKGLEVLEARHLFQVPLERIEVVVHPESIIHSMVEFVDGSVLAQLSDPDMRLPIQYALTWPRRTFSLAKPVNFAAIGKLTFHRPDTATFRCLKLAYLAGRIGGTMPAAMNAANEVAVQAFIEGRIGFLHIPEVILGAMERTPRSGAVSVKAVLEADRLAREEAGRLCLSRSKK